MSVPRTERIVLPSGKANSDPTIAQNWNSESGLTNTSLPDPFRVHGPVPTGVRTSNRHEKSLTAAGFEAKFPPAIDGTPPAGKSGAGPASHTAGLPSPSTLSEEI